MSAFNVIFNGKDLAGTEWNEDIHLASIYDQDPDYLPEPPVGENAQTPPEHPADAQVSPSVGLEDGRIVVDIPSRHLEAHGRALIKALDAEEIYNERYPHVIVDPDGSSGKGVRIDVEDSPASRAALSNWIVDESLEGEITLRGGFEVVHRGPRFSS